MAAGSGTQTYQQPAYPLAAGEITLGTVPTSFAYPADLFVDPRRYGADQTGVSSAVAAMTTALAVGAQKGNMLFLGPYPYSVGTSLNGYPFVTLLGNKFYGSSNAGTVNVLSLSASGADNTSPGTGRALMLFGRPNTYTAELVGSATSGQSYGLAISAGSTSADRSFQIREKTGATDYFVVRGDGLLQGRGPTAAALLDVTPDTATATGTLTGCTTSPTNTVTLTKMGNIVVVQMTAVSGTSNTTAMTLTGAIPAAFQPARQQDCPVNYLNDNSVNTSGGVIISPGSSTLSFTKGASTAGASFTAAGTKGISAPNTFAYSLA